MPQSAERKREYNREWRKRNAARRKQYEREYRETHREQRRATKKRHYQEHIERYRVRHRHYARKRLGPRAQPTRPEPDACELCGRQSPAGQSLHLDHDHVTGGFRGWLCTHCNHGLGSFRDSPQLLRAAAHYLVRSIL